MERLSAQDAIFLYVEDSRTPMHIGAVAILEGPAPRYADLVRVVARRLHLVPRYRQRVRFVPLQLGRPVWVDDPRFQVLYHVRRTAVPPPGGDDQLRELAGQLLEQHLDREKPLWEIWMVEGLRDGRWALVFKNHHCMVDGVAGTDLLNLIFDRSPHPRRRPDVPWAPEPEPGDIRLVLDAWSGGLTEPLQQLADLPGMLRAPLRNPRGVLDLLGSLTDEWLRPREIARALNGRAGPHRRWSWVKGSLADASEVRRALGGTLNDVVLAAITRGFRELLLGRGEPVEGRVVRTLVPVSVRAESEQGLVNNRVSGIFPDLPVGISSPAERLAFIGRQIKALKDSEQADVGDALIGMADLLPAALLAIGGRVGVNTPQWLVQTVTTNVPGPRRPLYVAGRRLLDYYPYVPVGGWLRINVAIFSYAGELNFGATGDYDAVPDLDVFCEGIRKGMAELVACARRRTRPRPLAAIPGGRHGIQPQRHAAAVSRSAS